MPRQRKKPGHVRTPSGRWERSVLTQAQYDAILHNRREYAKHTGWYPEDSPFDPHPEDSPFDPQNRVN